MPHNFGFTLTSSNKKTGPIPVSMTQRNSCPTSCPLSSDAEGGCYAESGHVRIHWQRLERQGLTLDELCARIAALPRGQLFRHNVAGDLPTVDREGIDADALRAIVTAARKARGFTYTHHRLDAAASDGRTNAAHIDAANVQGFTVNISTNSPEHADAVADAYPWLPLVTILPEDAPTISRTPAGRTVVVCPAVTAERQGMPPGAVTCASCELCANRERRSIVGFPVHGTGKKKAARVIMMRSAGASAKGCQQ